MPKNTPNIQNSRIHTVSITVCRVKPGEFNIFQLLVFDSVKTKKDPGPTPDTAMALFKDLIKKTKVVFPASTNEGNLQEGVQDTGRRALLETIGFRIMTIFPDPILIGGKPLPHNHFFLVEEGKCRGLLRDQVKVVFPKRNAPYDLFGIPRWIDVADARRNLHSDHHAALDRFERWLAELARGRPSVEEFEKLLYDAFDRDQAVKDRDLPERAGENME